MHTTYGNIVSGFLAINYITCYLSVLKEKKERWQISEERTKIFIINGM